MSLVEYAIYGLPVLLLLGWFMRQRARLEHESSKAQEEAAAAGLMEPPASLHPIIDPARCIGCGSCIRVCPEQAHHTVLGLIDGRAQLVGPADCIGHGACKIVCPVDAITLVFGSERRGVDIPLLSPNFETSVPGVFVAGELGGMGLISNALKQGREAVEAIHQRGNGRDDRLDVFIVGAGPAGFAAALTALAKKMRCVTVEQESLGGAVYHYPRGKLVLTSPATVPLVGKIKIRQTSKEELLEFWREAERRTGLKIKYKERVDKVEKDGDGFVVHTSKERYRTRSVLLTIGRRGTPRKLGVPGEELPKVVYRLIDPEQYRKQAVLVVGGGDSAIEAATSIAELGNAEVTLSHRGEAFDRAKPRNRERVAAAERAGHLRVLLKSSVKRIETESVTIEHEGSLVEIKNDAVIVSAGGVLPTDFLKRIGITVETKYGTA